MSTDTLHSPTRWAWKRSGLILALLQNRTNFGT
jgi:hypothetical protein